MLLGIVQSDGRVCLTDQKITIDKQFVQIANRGRTPEKRFRFAGRCIEGGCKQWKEERCGVIDSIMEIISPTEPLVLPDCPIRSECRWYKQWKGRACSVCPDVITDLSPD
jgi:hypothetical protein